MVVTNAELMTRIESLEKTVCELKEDSEEHGKVLARLDERSKNTLEKIEEYAGRITWLERRDWIGNFLTGALAIAGIAIK